MIYLEPDEAPFLENMLKAHFPAEQRQGFDAGAWFSDQRGVLEHEGNCLLFTRQRHSANIHFCFRDRGRKALKIAKGMFAKLKEDFGADLIFGFVPVKNKGARMFCRLLGCKSHGIFKDRFGREQEDFSYLQG